MRESTLCGLKLCIKDLRGLVFSTVASATFKKDKCVIFMLKHYLLNNSRNLFSDMFDFPTSANLKILFIKSQLKSDYVT